MVDTKVDILAEKLRQRIKVGEFGTSGRIPPRRVLAEQLETTHETVNKVVQLLQSEGLLMSRDKSVYVRQEILILPVFIPNYDQYVRENGYEPVSTFLEKPDLVPLPKKIADLMMRKEGEMVPHRLLRQGIKYPAGVVHYRLSENFYNPDLIKGEIFRKLQSDPQFDTWIAIKEKYGIEVVKSDNIAFARIPSSEEKDFLDIARVTPVLELNRVQLAQDGLPVMVNKLVFIGNRVELRFPSEITK